MCDIFNFPFCHQILSLLVWGRYLVFYVCMHVVGGAICVFALMIQERGFSYSLPNITGVEGPTLQGHV